MKSAFLITSAAAAGLLVAACAEQPYYGAPATTPPMSTYGSQAPVSSQVGYVERIEVVRKNAGSGAVGTVIGGIVGGLLGHQIGSGTGQTAATIAGAVGGAAVGSQIEQRRARAEDETFRVTVRLDNGGYQIVTQDNITDLRTGDRVRIDGNRLYRY